MRLIDADVLKPHDQLEPMGNGKYEYVEVVYKDDIDDAPTIDAVPVVRCRDCKRVQTTNCPLFKAKWGYTDNDYCSCGKRREDVEE